MTNTMLNEFFNSLSSSKEVEIYVDGACSGNPGPGGWGIVFRDQENEATLFGGEPSTTNNRMELQAAIQALKNLPKDQKATIYTDSQYVKNGITLWLSAWKKREWLNSEKKPVKNQDLWQELDELNQKHSINWQWIRGHDGNIYNEQADTLARRAIIAVRMREDSFDHINPES